jgi:hypothetical protein
MIAGCPGRCSAPVDRLGVQDRLYRSPPGPDAAGPDAPGPDAPVR